MALPPMGRACGERCGGGGEGECPRPLCRACLRLRLPPHLTLQAAPFVPCIRAPRTHTTFTCALAAPTSPNPFASTSPACAWCGTMLIGRPAQLFNLWLEAVVEISVVTQAGSPAGPHSPARLPRVVLKVGASMGAGGRGRMGPQGGGPHLRDVRDEDTGRRQGWGAGGGAALCCAAGWPCAVACSVCCIACLDRPLRAGGGDRVHLQPQGGACAPQPCHPQARNKPQH